MLFMVVNRLHIKHARLEAGSCLDTDSGGFWQITDYHNTWKTMVTTF